MNAWRDFWFLRYDRKLLRFDLIAGLTAAAVVVPKAMALAVVAGLPVEVGLYTAFVPVLAYALLGTSRRLSVSSTTIIALLTLGELATVAPGAGAGDLIAAAATLACLVGAILLVASFLRLGFIANFISAPVLTGFKAGVGLVIVVDQLPKLFGFHIDKAGFFRDLVSLGRHLPETHVVTLVLALAVIVALVVLERFLPRVPAALVAVVAAIGVSAWLGLGGRGVELVGAVPAGLPSLSWPDLSLVKLLLPGALGIALMAFVESVAAGESFARRGEPAPDANRELFALGAANILGGFSQAFPASGGISQTAVNSAAGARTQLAGLITAVVAVVIMLFLAPLLALLPLAALAAIVVVVSVHMMNPAAFAAILRVRKTEFIWAIVTFVGVVLLGTLEGILVAVALSVMTIFYQANRPPVYALGRKSGTNVFRPLDRYPGDETFPGLLIVRTEGRLNFASAPRTRAKFDALIDKYSPRVVVLALDAVPDIEYTALGLIDEAEERLSDHGVTVWLAALNPRALDVVRRSPLGKRLGNERMFAGVEEAVEAYLLRNHAADG
ncbi:MAG: SulP family inorganic anion transporter [Candidatus Coatesbacteria bacterium]|nr:MAG: SulP family inorganic anion transporter [Candidatus Coatesbacteria bacterium]